MEIIIIGVAIPLKQGLIFNKGIRLIRAVNGSQSL